MNIAEPNQANRRIVGLSTAIIPSAKGEARIARLILAGLLIIGVGVTGPA